MSAAIDELLASHPQLLAVRQELVGLDRYELTLLEWKIQWRRTARPKQLPPPGDWTTWGIKTGRGFGKTLAGANWIGIEAADDPGSYSGLIGSTGDDVRKVMIEGPTGLLNVVPALLIEDYNITLHEIRLWNGSVIRGFSAEEPKRLRGPQHHRVWADEVAAWTEGVDTWDMMIMGLRLGTHPRVLWTSTPKYVELMQILNADKTAIIIGGSTHENKANLPASFFKEISKYEGTKLGRQEIYGEDIDPEEGGIVNRAHWRLWSHKNPLPVFKFIVMSLDTAFTEKTFDKKRMEADPTACQVWGLFDFEDQNGKIMTNCMLLNAWGEHLSFPELFKRVKKERAYTYGDADEPLIKTYLQLETPGHQGRPPDLIIIEDKGSGISLRQQLAVEGIDAFPYNPKRLDKLARLHSVAPMWPSGRIWALESERRPGSPKSWAEPVIAQICTYQGPGTTRHDDHVDACTQALRYLRDNFIGAIMAPHLGVRALSEDERISYNPSLPNPYAS